MTKRSIAALITILGSIVLSGCMNTHPWRTREKPWTADSIAGAKQVRVNRIDGTRVTMTDAAIGRDEEGEFLSGNQVPDKGQLSWPVKVRWTEVARLETNRLGPENGLGNVAMGAGRVVVVLVVLVIVVFAMVGPGLIAMEP